MHRVRSAVNLTLGKISTTAILASGESIKVDDLKIGDVIAVRTGDMILADGVVSKGQAVLDESALTGEALPIAKTKGDRVLSSGVVQNGYIEVEVTSNPCDSTIRKVNQSVADVQADRSEFAKIVDSFAAYWTPCVLMGAVGLALIAGGSTNDWHIWVSCLGCSIFRFVYSLI
jgi:Cd2+/Zn2+-exporting ATPase